MCFSLQIDFWCIFLFVLTKDNYFVSKIVDTTSFSLCVVKFFGCC
nr:MAG TPA: hypothetical protein [Caudoviricetes sp.]